MLIRITTTATRATELGYLLHKNPANVFRRELSFGQAWVFYPEASDERTTCALLMEVDPIGLVRGRKGAMGIDQYVNDRSYVAGSLTSVALSRCFNSALGGRASQKAERLTESWPFEVQIEALACRGGKDLIARFFEPLGYKVEATGFALDTRFPDWGDSQVFQVRLRGEQNVQSLLEHLYVLLPVVDNEKHYYVGEDEVDKLLAHGSAWLPDHPEKPLIVRRYLKYRAALAGRALSQLDVERTESDEDWNAEEQRLESELTVPIEIPAPVAEVADDAPRLHQLRLMHVLGVLRDPGRGIGSVLDLGCGEGQLLQLLIRESQFQRVVGMDVSARVLQWCERRLKLDRLPEARRQRIELLQGSLVYRDPRLAGFDAAALVEVIEHLDPARLRACERVVFEHARPRYVVVTTPNREYNVVWPALAAGKMRHRDHRFEWTREEFTDWCRGVGERFGYLFTTHAIGSEAQEHPGVGTPSQMAVFGREAG